jgi:hypothetical protein
MRLTPEIAISLRHRGQSVEQSGRPARFRARPTRGKIREAILSTKGYKGAEGEYNFDEFGDGLHGYNVVHNEKGTIVFDKHIEFTD